MWFQVRQQGSGHYLKSFLCFSSSAGSCLPSTPGSCQIFGPYEPTTSPTTKFPGKNTKQYFVGVLMSADAHTGIVTDPKPLKLVVVFLGDKQEQFDEGKKLRVSEWHNLGSHVSLTHEVLKALFWYGRHLLTFFVFSISVVEPAAAGGHSDRRQAPG